LTPKRKIMYEITRNSRSDLEWGEEEIMQHYNDVVNLLKRKDEIFGITN